MLTITDNDMITYTLSGPADLNIAEGKSAVLPATASSAVQADLWDTAVPVLPGGHRAGAVGDAAGRRRVSVLPAPPVKRAAATESGGRPQTLEDSSGLPVERYQPAARPVERYPLKTATPTGEVSTRAAEVGPRLLLAAGACGR